MAWKDDLNNAKKVFQNGTLREKLEYIWDYYKWHLLFLIFIIVIIGNIIYTNVNEKKDVLQGIFINSTAEKDAGSELEQNFLDFSPIDTEKEEIFFDTNYYFSMDMNSPIAADSYETLQIMTAKIAVGEIDFMIGDLKTMNGNAYRQHFYELPELLSEETLEKYESCFLYYDKSFVKKINRMDSAFEEKKLIVYPDPKKPELMEEPVPILIDVSECDKLKGVYPYTEDAIVMAFAVNGSNSEKALAFLDYLMK